MLPCLLLRVNVQLLRLLLGVYKHRAGAHKFALDRKSVV